ncbi:MAG TPA: GNAT family N-acetyltransferase [Usitatibacter sp.]|nr:GNAT family N-acetyltransferase [Usitatibacter sp.]
MTSRGSLRVAHVEDIPAMHVVRMAVRENPLSDPSRIQPRDYEEMIEKRGRGWVYEIDGRIVGFSVGDHSRRNIWALFIEPGFEGRGIGRVLHDAMVKWLFEQSPEPLWLTTTPSTRAESFYRAAGWRFAGEAPHGEIRFEMDPQQG